MSMIKDDRQIESNAENGPSVGQLSAVGANICGREADTTHSLLQSNGHRRPKFRRRSPIPDSDSTIRDRVAKIIPTMGYEPTYIDIAILCRWVRGYRTWQALDDRLQEHGVARADGTPTKWLDQWRAQSDHLARLENQLGLSAVARAGLGVDIGRMRQLDLAAQMARTDA
jgi:hypothetical protein